VGVLLAPPRATAADLPPPPRRPSGWHDHFLQYGAALAVETLVDTGRLCPEGARAPCILGSGTGLALRGGYRGRGPWFLGGAYEFSRHASSNLLRLAILQQLRAEFRRYLVEGQRVVPFAAAVAGGALYGNEWGVATSGGVVGLGGGAELPLSRTAVVGAQLTYRLLGLQGFRDSAGQLRQGDALGLGLAQFVGLEVVFEVRAPLARPE